MHSSIEKTEALIYSRRVLGAMYASDPYRPVLSLYPTVWLDERYQRFNLLEGTLPYLLPTQSRRWLLEVDAVGTRLEC